MKKTITRLFVAGMFLFGANAFGQASRQAFSATSSDGVTMNEQNGIKVSYQQGTLGQKPAICLGFQNTSNKEETFTWTLKDNKGKIVGSGVSIKLGAGQTLDITKNDLLKHSLTFVLETGTSGKDYKTEITLKN